MNVLDQIGREDNDRKGITGLNLGTSITFSIYTMLVVGVPNVGKSTIINALRLLSGKKKSAKTGAMPGFLPFLSPLPFFLFPFLSVLPYLVSLFFIF